MENGSISKGSISDFFCFFWGPGFKVLSHYRRLKTVKSSVFEKLKFRLFGFILRIFDPKTFGNRIKTILYV